MRISDWSSDVCSSDLLWKWQRFRLKPYRSYRRAVLSISLCSVRRTGKPSANARRAPRSATDCRARKDRPGSNRRSEEHTSELQSLMRISYAVFCLKKKKTRTHNSTQHTSTRREQTKKNKTRQNT